MDKYINKCSERFKVDSHVQILTVKHRKKCDDFTFFRFMSFLMLIMSQWYEQLAGVISGALSYILIVMIIAEYVTGNNE